MTTTYAAITIAEVKGLILFNFDTLVFHDGSTIVNDDFITAQIQLSEEEVYSHIRRSDTPATYKPDDVRLVVKKLAAARVENAMIKAKIIKTGELVDIDELFNKNKHFIFQPRKSKELIRITNVEDSFTMNDDYANGLGW